MKKKCTRKIRKNKRTTQRRKNRSYKRMKGGVINSIIDYYTDPITNLDVNATRVISESLTKLGFYDIPGMYTAAHDPLFVMPTDGDILTRFRYACSKFIDMMNNNENFSTFYNSNKKSIDPMFELLLGHQFTRLENYESKILELFKRGMIPNTALGIETTLEKYIKESIRRHRKHKKFNLLAFALFIMTFTPST
jgi:hypothetical protein